MIKKHRYPINEKHRLAICLRYLGHGRSLHACAHEFLLGRTTVAGIIYEVCQAIVSEFRKEAFPKPTREDWQRSADGFNNMWGYPRRVGSIDGKHFKCVAPNNTGSTYFNFKGTFSIVLLIVADSNYRILLIDCGGKGKNSDSGKQAKQLSTYFALFRTSPLKEFLQRSKSFFPPPAPLGNEGIVEYHILADGGFGQNTYMIRPYHQSEALRSPTKAHFNECFSSARRVVENVFGIITSRFRVFQAPLHGTPEHMKLLIITACVLHNLLTRGISREELVRRYPPDSPNVEEEFSPGGRAPYADTAHVQRDRFANFFAHRDGYH